MNLRARLIPGMFLLKEECSKSTNPNVQSSLFTTEFDRNLYIDPSQFFEFQFINFNRDNRSIYYYRRSNRSSLGALIVVSGPNEMFVKSSGVNFLYFHIYGTCQIRHKLLPISDRHDKKLRTGFN